MNTVSIYVIAGLMLATASALPLWQPCFPNGSYHHRVHPLCPGGGTGPFNPSGPRFPTRFRRTTGSIVVDQPVNGGPSVSAGMDHQVYQGEHGSVSVYGGGTMHQGGSAQGEAGIRGEFHWGDGGGYDDARYDEVDRIRKEMKID